jgi:hypothetical protein
MNAPIKHIVIFKNDTITLTHHEIQKYWLYDKAAGMNLAMRAETEHEAFAEAIGYYQERLAQTKKELKDITKKVDSFLEQFRDDEDMRPENY